ncbi:MAG: hypothetical protein KDB27_22565 [Planctomycetales bacterium]|nr:hypothetical protein [Planctomycetales bacterium]
MEQVRRKENRNRGRSRLRFSIALLLFVMACVGGWFSGYRSGYDAGDNAWNYKGIYAKTYDVHDLVKPMKNSQTGTISPDFGQVVAAVRAVRETEKRTLEVTPFELNLSLVVRGSGIEHRRITSILSDLRSQIELAQQQSRNSG